jgi:lipoprotein-anchoring transpeptidase ErfK/SrfK
MEHGLMGNKRKIIGVLLLPVAGVLISAARAEYLKPRAAGAQQPAAIRLKADLSDKILYVEQGGKVVKTYTFADGSAKYPTPKGTFRVGKVIWNPAWVPPDSKWARKKTPKDPGHPDNPMKLVKIFFKEPDYYIHGTDQIESIGSSASHGCLRMDPADAAELAIRVMEASGARKDADWYQNAIEKGETRTVTIPRKVEMVITE